MILVTQPFLPPQEEYIELLNGIWDRVWLTNNGPLVKQLEKDLEKYLDTNNLLYTGNGTIALQIAIKALDLKGEIITTPFSYVATTTSIIWENCSPVFVDIDKTQLTIDPKLIESAITEKTSAILATHVYGIPCHVEEIQVIAKKHNLKIIYDAAHAFGTKFKGKSILEYGDISTLSMHATKLYHTIEGGAIITPHNNLVQRISMLRNFGHNGPDRFDVVGINGKNSEFHAAMGLVNLKYIKDILRKRKEQYQYYIENLKEFNGDFAEIPKDVEYNYAYLPIIFKTENDLLKVNSILESNNIFCRRYFYPTLNSLVYIQQKGCTPVADRISKQVLCLPLYHTLKKDEQDSIIDIIMQNQN